MDDGGQCTDYWAPDSPYQGALDFEVYQALKILSIAFINTVEVSAETIPSTSGGATGWTLQFTGGTHDKYVFPKNITAVPSGRSQRPDTRPTDGYTNHQYFEATIHDAQLANPNIEITVTLNPFDGLILNRVFDGVDPTTDEGNAKATNFAQNVVTFLDHYGINGIDIDWELCSSGNCIANQTTAPQFVSLFTAVGEAFHAKEAEDDSKNYLLTFSPATDAGTFDHSCGPVVNCYFDAVNLQMYASGNPNWTYSVLGVSEDLFVFGARFEDPPAGSGDTWDTAQDVVNINTGMYHYPAYMVWRLNSQNWPYEQGQTLKLHDLVVPNEYGDLNGDGCVNGADLGILLGAWSICP